MLVILMILVTQFGKRIVHPSKGSKDQLYHYSSTLSSVIVTIFARLALISVTHLRKVLLA